MTFPLSNPRRRYKTQTSPIDTSVASPSMHHASTAADQSAPGLALRKSSTFHSPSSPPSDDDPIVSIPLLSKRSPTSHKDLEDAVAAGQRRIANLIGELDRSLSGLESLSSVDSQKTARPDDLPVPRFMIDAHVADPIHMDVDKPELPKLAPRRKHHPSDSGIGSTVTLSDDLQVDEAGKSHAPPRPASAAVGADRARPRPGVKYPSPASITEVQSGINGTNAVAAGPAGVHHALSAFACRQIQKYIIVPILKEQSLKAFHPLIKGIPVRVGRKEITCLRDLEKVLLWLAPVRQYAAMIHEARGRTAAGEPREDDPSRYSDAFCVFRGLSSLTLRSDEQLILHGGLSQTGRPAELVRLREGQLISLRTGEPIDPEADSPVALKFASVEDREEYELSMARRRKNAPERVIHRCGECDKEFKRPCDLTKHEKTHSRPWKCSDASCKYARYGWPTEKERDRHINDKHSATPSMYKCQYHPCPYESKRESNCKQHMEKAHGWAYVRSKNNGKIGKKPGKPASKSPPTPQATPGSHIFEASGSEFGDPTSPYARTHSRSTSIATSSIHETSPYLGVGDNTFQPYESSFGWDPNQRLTPVSPYTPSSHHPSLDAASSSSNALGMPSSYGTSMEEADPPLFNGTFDWSNMDLDADFTSMNIQLFTPATSVESRALDTYGSSSRNPSISLDVPIKNPNLSPGAEGGAMLYSPYEQHNIANEGYDEFATTDMGKPSGDFALFDSRPASSLSQQASMNLFSDLPPFQPTTWNPQNDSQTFHMDLMES